MLLASLIFGEAKVVSWREFYLAEVRQLLLQNPQRVHLIHYLIAKHNYQSYMEIGICDQGILNSILAACKVVVDPLTSDDFFASNEKTFDLIFIDGVHGYEQVLRDVENSLRCLNPNGVIVMRHCLPKRLEHQGEKPILWVWSGVCGK